MDQKPVDTTLYSRRGATVSPDGRWIAFVADPELRPDSVVEAESDSLERLPYDSARDEAPRNRSDIFVISTNGGAPRRVADFMGDERQISWSPDGRSIAFVASPERTKSRRIYVVSAGKLAVNIDKSFPLADASKARAYSMDGHAEGKIILVVDAAQAERK